jgi:histidine triad (HIT) family protein
MECFWHTLIIPKKHFENIFDIDDEYLQNFILFMKSLSIKYKHWLWATWINLLNANGKDAQQSIPHLHFHLIPRFPNDAMDVWPKFEKYNWDHKTDLNKIKNLII